MGERKLTLMLKGLAVSHLRIELGSDLVEELVEARHVVRGRRHASHAAVARIHGHDGHLVRQCRLARSKTLRGGRKGARDARSRWIDGVGTLRVVIFVPLETGWALTSGNDIFFWAKKIAGATSKIWRG